MKTILLALAWFAEAAIAAPKTVPPAPYYYVLDEPEVITPSVREKIQSILIEHDQLTGEQLVVAVFKSLDGEDLVEYTSRVFETWAIGKRGKDNGVLLALYWNDRKARVEVGYGLEPLLTDAKSKGVLEDHLIPALKAQDPDSAITSSVVAILETIGSPLFENGKAEQRLQVTPRPHSAPWRGPLPLLAIIVIFVLLSVLHFFAKAEAHFTRGGWYRPNPFRRGGGGFGGWGGGGGGFGGFSGGGGRSGGGGASGSW